MIRKVTQEVKRRKSAYAKAQYGIRVTYWFLFIPVYSSTVWTQD